MRRVEAAETKQWRSEADLANCPESATPLTSDGISSRGPRSQLRAARARQLKLILAGICAFCSGRWQQLLWKPISNYLAGRILWASGRFTVSPFHRPLGSSHTSIAWPSDLAHGDNRAPLLLLLLLLPWSRADLISALASSWPLWSSTFGSKGKLALIDTTHSHTGRRPLNDTHPKRESNSSRCLLAANSNGSAAGRTMSRRVVIIISNMPYWWASRFNQRSTRANPSSASFTVARENRIRSRLLSVQLFNVHSQKRAERFDLSNVRDLNKSLAALARPDD